MIMELNKHIIRYLEKYVITQTYHENILELRNYINTE